MSESSESEDLRVKTFFWPDIKMFMSAGQNDIAPVCGCCKKELKVAGIEFLPHCDPPTAAFMVMCGHIFCLTCPSTWLPERSEDNNQTEDGADGTSHESNSSHDEDSQPECAGSSHKIDKAGFDEIKCPCCREVITCEVCGMIERDLLPGGYLSTFNPRSVPLCRPETGDEDRVCTRCLRKIEELFPDMRAEVLLEDEETARQGIRELYAHLRRQREALRDTERSFRRQWRGRLREEALMGIWARNEGRE